MDPNHVEPRSELEELERQVERGSMFTQAVLQKSFTRLSVVEAMMGELVAALTDKGVVGAEDIPGVTAVVESPGPSEPEPDEDPAAMMKWPAIAIREDPSEPPDDEAVDCDARMATCHAVCCKLKFALSSEEVEQGIVKWDIGHPYIIRQNSTGYCCHNDAATGGCGVYQNRPRVCSGYSCRHDARIWKDFDNMIINQEWIDAHIGAADAFLFVDVTTSKDEPAAAPPAEPTSAAPTPAEPATSFS